MFKVQRHNREPRSGERFDFKLSNFQAIQVPKGWDKLLVAVVLVETGKTIAKSSKAHVRNGNCQWTETLSESIWISQDEFAKPLEERLFKFVVSMGSARSGILGEVTVNVAEYIDKKAPPPALLPLQKCNYGSILQVKIQCTTPRTKLRSKDSSDSSHKAENQNGNNQDLENKSNASDDSLARDTVSLSSKDLGSASHHEDLISREASFSSFGSHQSSGSAESYTRRGNASIINDANGSRQNSGSSVNSPPHVDSRPEDSYRSNPSSFKSRTLDPQNQLQESAQGSERFESSPLTNSGSSKNYLEVAEDTINELRGEAKMWERNARKLMTELDILRNDFSDQSKKQASSEMELSAACTERDGLRKEVDKLKLSLEERVSKQVGKEDPGSPSEGSVHLQQEMEKEIKYQRESNAKLTQQLKRSQESNVELVDILHELEETIEKQKADMENFSEMQMKVNELEISMQEKLEENKKLSLQLQELEKHFSQNNHSSLGDIETEYKNKLLLKDKEISNLERKLSEHVINKPSKEPDSSQGSKEDLLREIDSLKEKLEELEQDCNELTNENLELLYKLKESSPNSKVKPTSPGFGLRAISFSMSKPEARELNLETREAEDLKESTENDQIADLIEQLQFAFHQLKKPWYGNSTHLRNGFKSEHIDSLNLKSKNMTAPEEFVYPILGSLIELNKLLEERIDMCGESLRNGELKIEESKYDIAEAQKKLEDHILKENNLNLYIQELESINTDLQDNLAGLEKELIERGSVITTCEAKLLSDEEEIRFLRQCQEELEAQIFDLRKEKDQIEGNMKSLLMESQKQKSDLEDENMQLSEKVSSLEAQLRDMTEERESKRLEILNSESTAFSLEDEIRKLKTEMETEKFNLNKKLKDTENQLLKAKEKHENLNMEMEKLVASAENLTEESNFLEKENGQLRKKESQLQERCTVLEAQLKDSQLIRSELSELVEALEEKISSMLEEFSLKEKNLVSELEALLKENMNQKEKLALGESLLVQINVEKKTEIENLQREIEQLKEQISFTRDEGEGIASAAENEASILRANNAKLESSLQEIQSQLRLAENEVNAVRKDALSEVQDLMAELSTTRKSHELLVADYEKKLKFLGSYMSSEEKMNSSLNDLELKLTVSECERQQLVEEIASLKTQLQEETRLRDEIVTLESELNASKVEKVKVEASLDSVSRDCEELKSENDLVLQKVNKLVAVIAEVEDWKLDKLVLEEKLQKMEHAKDAELEHELSRVNSECQVKIRELEMEKDEYLKRIEALEEQLKVMEERMKERSRSRSKKGEKYSLENESPHAERLQLLESELAQALEENNKCKIQLQRVSSDGRNSNENGPTAEGEVVPKERFERTKSSLETELKDLRERYFTMSLQYAEVEAEREDLVMKLKASKSGKKWFS